jgi:phosphate transport system substrate-binding protein
VSLLRSNRTYTAALCLLASAGVTAAAVGQVSKAGAPPAATDTLRIWGDPAMESVVLALEQRFQRDHPGVRFETKLMGTDTAMPGLYNGKADLALLGRESNTTESDGFLHTLQYPPLELHLMTGSLDAEAKSYAPVIFVSRSNPLQGLTLQQLDRIIGCGQPGGDAPARTWGDLGLSGAWKDKPIHVYMFDITSGTGTFLLHKLQGESRKLNWQIIREFSDTRRGDGSTYTAGQQTVDALKSDPYGLAFSGMQYARDGIKPLALAVSAGSPLVAATKASLIDGSYSLARMTYAFVNRAPGTPLSPQLREFLRFLYSDEGRAVVAGQPGFLPLSSPDAALQESRLP